jgi:hypothetical protein
MPVDPPEAYPLSDASRAFLDRARATTAPVAHEPIARVEVPGMSLLVIEASERYEGCPGCAEKDAEISRLARAVADDGMRQNAESSARHEDDLLIAGADVPAWMRPPAP